MNSNFLLIATISLASSFTLVGCSNSQSGEPISLSQENHREESYTSQEIADFLADADASEKRNALFGSKPPSTGSNCDNLIPAFEYDFDPDRDLDCGGANKSCFNEGFPDFDDPDQRTTCTIHYCKGLVGKKPATGEGHIDPFTGNCVPD